MFNFIKNMFFKADEVQAKIEEVQTKTQDKVVEVQTSLEEELKTAKEQLTTYKDFYSSTSNMIKDIPIVLPAGAKDEIAAKLQHIVEFYKAQLATVKVPRS